MQKWWAIAWRPLIVAIGGLIGFLWLQYSSSQQLIIANHYYDVSIMRSDAEREKGLSGTENLPTDDAMLFVFPLDGKWGFWMKDMNYPIDIVWLNSDRQVVYVVKAAQPSSYPDTIFKPGKNSRYVIELASGTIERTGINIGDKATLPSGL